MDYFLDTEFNHHISRIEPISVGIVSADGREFYSEISDSNLTDCNEFVVTNVFPHIKRLNGDDTYSFTRKQTADKILEFTGTDKHPVFYTWYGAFDWVVFADLFGEFSDIPYHYPRYTRDMKHLVDMLRISKDSIPKQVSVEHNALEDARWNKLVFDTCIKPELDHIGVLRNKKLK